MSKQVFKEEKKLEPFPKLLFHQIINQNQTALGETVLSEYLVNLNKDSPSPNFEFSHQEKEVSEELKQNEGQQNEEKFKLSEFFALMTKREQEVFQPIYFNILIVGECALGKTTFIEAILDKVLFNI